MRSLATRGARLRPIGRRPMSAPSAAVMARDGVGELAELLATQPTDWEATFWAMDCAKITATESVSTAADGTTSVRSIARVKWCGVLPLGGPTSERHYDAAGTAFTGRGARRTFGSLTHFDPVAKRATYHVQVQHRGRTYDAATYSEEAATASGDLAHLSRVSHVSPCPLRARSTRLCRADDLGEGEALGDVHITTAAVRTCAERHARACGLRASAPRLIVGGSATVDSVRSPRTYVTALSAGD